MPRPSAWDHARDRLVNEAVIDANTLSQGFVIAASDVTIDGFEVKNATAALIDSWAPRRSATPRCGTTSSTKGSHGRRVAKGIRLTAVSGSTVEFNNVFTVADDGVEVGASAAGASNGRHGPVQRGSRPRLGRRDELGNLRLRGRLDGDGDQRHDQGNLVYNHFGNDAIKVGAENGQDRLVSGGRSPTTRRPRHGPGRHHHRRQQHQRFAQRGVPQLQHQRRHLRRTRRQQRHGREQLRPDNSAGVAAILVGDAGRPACADGQWSSVSTASSITRTTSSFSETTPTARRLWTARPNWFGSESQATVTDERQVNGRRHADDRPHRLLRPG